MHCYNNNDSNGIFTKFRKKGRQGHKNVCAEMIKLRFNTKRILGITMCMSEQFGTGLMDEIKTIQDYVF